MIGGTIVQTRKGLGICAGHTPKGILVIHNPQVVINQIAAVVHCSITTDFEIEQPVNLYEYQPHEVLEIHPVISTRNIAPWSKE